jgi:hypothetical protein
MLLPPASTFTWKLVNGPNREIIRGDTSIFRCGAGGLSYISKGSFPCGFHVGASWAEAAVKAQSRGRQIRKLRFKTLI